MKKLTTLLTGRLALTAITAHPDVPVQARDAMLQNFLQRWRDKALVVNLWFSVQARSPLTDVAAMQQLEAHETFDINNPNKVRSLYSAFSALNHKQFHAADGSGYRFLADRILQLDVINPQVAARLATPLTRFRRYETQRRRLMRGELERMAARQNLSKDLFEVVTKSLA